MAFQALNAPPTNPNASIAVPHRGVALSAVDEAFGPRPDLQAAIRLLLGKNEQAEHYELFEGIARYVLQLQSAASAAVAERDELDDRLTKRRKLDDGAAPKNVAATSVSNGSAAPAAAAGASATAAKPKTEQFANYSGQRFEGLSFSAPQRKKLTLEIASKPDQGVRAIGAEGGTEFGIPYKDLEYIFQLPVPDKATAQHNFCAFPRDAATATDDASYEPMVWTTSATRPKGADESTPTPSEAMATALQSAKCPLQTPSADEFASAIPQPHRKGETAYHVKAFRGSKDGYLFFMEPGIVWGFKKPLLFLPFSSIASVSYTAVLQRTFNLIIATNVGPDGVSGGEELEFQMLDQADFAGIDTYVKRHELNDASMAEARKAKRLNVNGPPRRAGAEAEGGDEGKGEGDESELAKAQREADEAAAQNPEDSDDEEDDENFDPGSEGESEGSGSSDEEEDGEGGGKGNKGKDEAEGGDDNDDEGEL